MRRNCRDRKHKLKIFVPAGLGQTNSSQYLREGRVSDSVSSRVMRERCVFPMSQDHTVTLGGEYRNCSAAESTSAEDDDESGGEWTTNRAREAKRGVVRLEVGDTNAPAPSFPEE